MLGTIGLVVERLFVASPIMLGRFPTFVFAAWNIGVSAAIKNFVTQTALQAAVRVCGGLAAMYATHRWLALLATAITPINWWIIRRAGDVQGLYGVVQNAALAKANAAAVETLGAMRTVQSNAGEVSAPQGSNPRRACPHPSSVLRLEHARSSWPVLAP